MKGFQLVDWVKHVGHAILDLLEFPNSIVLMSPTPWISSQLTPAIHQWFVDSQDSFQTYKMFWVCHGIVLFLFQTSLSPLMMPQYLQDLGVYIMGQ